MKIQKNVFPSLLALFASLTISANTSGVPQSPYDIEPLFEGLPVPEIVVRDMEGNEVDLSKQLQSGLSMVVFYRGGWCPYCNTHLEELQTIDADLKELGYDILALSPDKPEVLKAFMGDHDFNYTVYSDSAHGAGLGFGVAYHVDDKMDRMLKGYKIDLEKASGNNHRYLPVPAVFLVKDGVVEFSYLNPDYKKRLSGDVILAAAKFVKNKKS